MSPSLFPNYSSTLRGGCRASFLFAVAGAERQKRVCTTLCCEDFVPERKLQRGDDLRRATSLSLFSTLTPLSTSFTPEKKTRAISTIEKLTDYLTKVVVQGKQSSSLHVREIMTARSKLLTVPPQVREGREREGGDKEFERERERGIFPGLSALAPLLPPAHSRHQKETPVPLKKKKKTFAVVGRRRHGPHGREQHPPRARRRGGVLPWDGIDPGRGHDDARGAPRGGREAARVHQRELLRRGGERGEKRMREGDL